MMHTVRKSLLWVLIVSLLFAGFAACGETEPQNDPPATEAAKGLVLAENGESAYTIVRSENASQDLLTNIKPLRTFFSEQTGADIKISDDWVEGRPEVVDNGAPEILLGKTNRKENAQAQETLSGAMYVIAVIDNKLVILGVSDYYLTKAVEYILTWPAEHPDWFADRKFTVPGDYVYTYTEDVSDQLSTLIASGTKFRVVPELVIEAKPVNEFHVAQGAASDGEYAYFMLRQSGDGEGVVVKYDLTTGRFSGQSKPVYVLHGNDMTYCKAQDLLYLVHGSSEGKIVTTMNPHTLEVVEQSVNLPAGAGAMSYSWETDRFVCSQGGATLHILDGNLKLIKSYGKSAATGYTAQGMGSDEMYCYFPMSGSTDNILMVYSWNGQHITDVHIPLKLESESMFWVNDTYYVNFYQSGQGAKLYQLHFEIEE